MNYSALQLILPCNIEKYLKKIYSDFHATSIERFVTHICLIKINNISVLLLNIKTKYNDEMKYNCHNYC